MIKYRLLRSGLAWNGNGSKLINKVQKRVGQIVEGGN